MLKGHLRIELDDAIVELREGESFVVRKGMRHNPVADRECHILLIERKSTLHTGDTVTGLCPSAWCMSRESWLD